MFKSLVLIASFFVATNAFAMKNTTELFLLDQKGEKVRSVGTVMFEDSKKGLKITTNLKSLTPGEHGFHIHENGTCDPLIKDGKIIPAGAAGGHYDPAKTGKHEGPNGNGHLGDLPKITVAKDGTSKEVLYAKRVKFMDVKGKAVMVHVGGDNYSDKPESLGGGGPRMACGVNK